MSNTTIELPILVTGGTGTLGTHVVAGLRRAGKQVRVLTRQEREGVEGIEYVSGDLATGEGVTDAVTGVNTVVHCAGSAKGDEDKARNLVLAAAGADISHIVYISVIGADRIPVVSGVDRAMFGYFGSKLAAEQIIAESGIPYTTLRAAQFHQMMLLVAEQMSKMPLIPLPSGFRVQPVDAGEVATRLVELALGEPAGLVAEMAGPKMYRANDLMRDYLRSVRKHRAIVPMRLPGRAARAFRGGANLAPERAVGRRTWEEVLVAGA